MVGDKVGVLEYFVGVSVVGVFVGPRVGVTVVGRFVGDNVGDNGAVGSTASVSLGCLYIACVRDSR